MLNFIAKPFGMLLMFLYELVGNYGLAIILFAVIVRVILLPFQMKSKRGTMNTMRLQPKLQELQKKHAANKTKLNEEVAKLYQSEGVNPMSGCLWGLLPIPIMIALFIAIRSPLTLMMGVDPALLAAPAVEGGVGGAIYDLLEKMDWSANIANMNQYYQQIAQARFITEHFNDFRTLSPALREIDFTLFGGINLGETPQWQFLWSTDWSDSEVWAPELALFLIPFITGASQMLSTHISRKLNPTMTPEGQGGTMQVMMMLMPLMSVYFAFITPGALGLYWTMGAVLQIGQDVWLTKRYTKIIEAEEEVRNAQRKEKEAEIEAKRLETERMKAEGIALRNPNKSKQKKQRTEKQEQLEKAAEWQKKNETDSEKEYEPSRVGDRRYARGRAYDPDRFARAAEDEGGYKDEDGYEDAAKRDDADDDADLADDDDFSEGDDSDDET